MTDSYIVRGCRGSESVGTGQPRCKERARTRWGQTAATRAAWRRRRRPHRNQPAWPAGSLHGVPAAVQHGPLTTRAARPGPKPALHNNPAAATTVITAAGGHRRQPKCVAKQHGGCGCAECTPGAAGAAVAEKCAGPARKGGNNVPNGDQTNKSTNGIRQRPPSGCIARIGWGDSGRGRNTHTL